MGAFCPICKTQQPFKRHLTINQMPAYKASDVLGHELGCGHYYGNEDFMKIQKTVNDVKLAYAQKARDLADAEKTEITKALSTITFKGMPK